MVRYADSHPELVKHYRRVGFAPNESFFPTILRNNPSFNLITNDHKRFIRWSHPETGHPDVLTGDDFADMTGSGKHFARKIDSRKDPQILDLLDAHIGVTAPAAAR
jgi:hypothetical protein